jgi:hypothetical protein
MTLSWAVVLVLMFCAVLYSTLSSCSCRTFRIVYSELHSFNATTDATAFGFRKRYINGHCQPHDDVHNPIDFWLQFGVGVTYNVVIFGLCWMKFAVDMTHSLSTDYYSDFERRIGRMAVLRIVAKLCIGMAVVTALLLVGLGSSTYCSADDDDDSGGTKCTSAGSGIVTAISLWLVTACAAKIGLYFEALLHENQLAMIPQALRRGNSAIWFLSALWTRLSRECNMCAAHNLRPTTSCDTAETTTVDTVRGPDGLDWHRTICTPRGGHGTTVVHETRERLPVPETACDNVETTVTGPFLLSMETLTVTKANGSSTTTTSMLYYTDHVNSQHITLQRRERREHEVHIRTVAKLEPFHAQALADNHTEATLHGTILPLPTSHLPTAETTTTLRRLRTTMDHSALDSLTSTTPRSVAGGEDRVIIERTVVISDTIAPKQECAAQITDPLCTVQERVSLV